MPSVVSEHSGPVAILAHSSEPFGDIHRLHEQSNGGPTPPGTQKSLRHGYEDGLIYKGALSIRTIPPPNGEMHDNTNGLSSLPNGRSSAGSRDKDSPRNDSGLGLGVNGSAENNERPFTLQNGKLKVPLDSPAVLTPNKGAVQPLHPIDPGTRVAPNGVDTDAGHQTTLPPSIVSAQEHAGGLLNGNPPLPVTSAQEAPKRNSTTVHRFSSPPAYQSTSQTGSNASNPIPKPQPPPLQHRHTLQVPKPGTTRTSRDGNEGAYTTGRFSPTIAASNARRNSLNLMRRNTRSLHSDAPHEEAPEDEDAMRWAEAIRQKRASKRRRRDEEDEDRVVVGTKVDQHHVNWVTAYNMLTGIRFTVSRTNAKLDRTLTDQDFTQKHKFSFDITGNELTPSAKYDFKFKDYAPWVFRHLRAIFGLDPADYLMSLTSKYILSELGSPGKSGSFFYFSRDYKYIIKTIHQAEHKFLRKILKDYYHHVKENPNTLLSQFYGLHRVKIPYGRKIHFVVMNNLFPPHRDIHQTFDLKGSTIGRDFKEEDLAKNPRATLKDLNWLRRKKHLELGPAKKEVFLDQVEKDVHLLQRLSIMDYSLLVGIHDCGKGNQENLRDKTLKVFQPGGEMSPDESIAPVNSFLSRTPSKLETQRKARELRQMIKQEKPIPMGQTTSKMPDTMDENPTRSPFYNDDGGFQATHEDNRPGEEIYYLGIIDLLTHYGTVKRLENFWKGLKHDKTQISPVPSHPYGERFIKFIKSITKSKEEVRREEAQQEAAALAGSRSPEMMQAYPPQHLLTEVNGTVFAQRLEGQDSRPARRSSSEESVPDRTLSTMRSPSAERTNDRAGMTLPVVDEAGESSSTGGRSGTDDEARRESRPPTPPKDHPITAKRRHEPEIRKSSDSNKALPPLPT